jgi:hypothetical protein
MKTKHALLAIAILLTACSGSGLRLTERQQIGSVSFQNVEGYSVETDNEGSIFIGSPDAEISVFMILLPNDYFDPHMTPTMVGGQYPEEVIPFDILVFLGFGNIELQPIHRYHNGDHLGYSRSFSSSSEGGDPIEGEYLFYTVGDQTFIAMGSVVRVEGDNRWDPQGKAAYDAIVESVQFVTN